MKLLANTTLEERQTTANLFAQELISLGNWWAEHAEDVSMSEYLEGDLERFPKMIREEMLRRGAKVE